VQFLLSFVLNFNWQFLLKFKHIFKLYLPENVNGNFIHLSAFRYFKANIFLIIIYKNFLIFSFEI